MTVIAAYVDRHGATAIGSDTECASSYRFEVGPKVHRWGPWWCGSCGSALWRRFLAVAPAEDFEPARFADAWVEWARARGHGGNHGGDHQWLNGSWLMARHGEIVAVGADGSITTHDRYAAIGSGEEIAVGAMFLARRAGWSARCAVKGAVDAAVAHAAGCGGRAHVELCEAPS